MTTGQGFGNESFVLYERLLSATDSAITVADIRRPGHPIVWANRAFEQLTGWSADEVEGRDSRFFLNEDDPAAARGLSLALDHGRGFRGAIPARRRDGTTWLSEVTVTPLRDHNGDLVACIVVHQDVTSSVPVHPARTRTRRPSADKPRRLGVEGRLARQVLDALEDGVVLYGADATIMDCNESALRMFGVREEEVIGRTTAELPFQLFFEDGTEVTAENSPAKRTLTSGEPARDVILRLEHGDESAWLAANFQPLDANEDDEATAVVASITDITERRHAEQQIAFLAYHDSLTELPNRTLLAEHLEQGLARARRYGRAVALLYIDLDGFKLVNDSFGHAAGDELLTRIATRLREGTRSADLLARQGGDEFLLLLTDIEGDATAVAERAAETIRHALESPFVLRGAEVQVGASVGVGLFPRDAQSARGLLLFADQAMYKAKGGRDSARRAPSLPTDPLERLALTTRLRNALAAGEFVLHWQPIMNLETGAIVSLEALLRWDDQERGLIPAAEFIPIAEEMGLIEQIDAWVVEAIARQARAWDDDGLAPQLSFNVSAHDLRRPGTLAAMAEKLAGTDLDASLFTVEVDESGALDARGQLAPALRDLHAAGIGIAIDRFGSGLSALSRLREMPLSALKIDGAFIARAPDDEATASLIDGILGFAGALGVSAIAENIETEEQRRFLIDHGCSTGQGFHLARPAGTAETTALLYRARETGT